MKNIEKATNNMKMVYSILCNLKKCTIFELQKLTKFRDVDLCLALGYLLQNYQISTCDILRLMYISNGKHPVIRRYVLFQVQRYGMFLENQIQP